MTTELKNEDRTKCSIWTRVMGFCRPFNNFNIGKKSEFKERKYFTESAASKSCAFDNCKEK